MSGLEATAEAWGAFPDGAKTPQSEDSFMKVAKTQTMDKSKFNFKHEEKGSTVIEQITTEVKTETLDMAQVTVGKMLFTNGAWLISKFAPQLTWYEKLFTSKEKRETAVLVGSYIALIALKTRYSHYVIDALTMYINMELQSKLVGGMTPETLEKIFSKLESK